MSHEEGDFLVEDWEVIARIHRSTIDDDVWVDLDGHGVGEVGAARLGRLKAYVESYHPLGGREARWRRSLTDPSDTWEYIAKIPASWKEGS
jgi:hypothetical protein